MKAQQMPVSMILHLLETEILSIPSNRLLRARSQDLSLTKLENARQVLLNVLSIYLVIQPILYKFIYLSSKLHCYKQFYFKMLQYLKDKSQVTFGFFSVERCTTGLVQLHHLQAPTEQISGPQSYLLHKGRVVSTVCPRLVRLANHTSILLHCAKAMEVKFTEI